MGRYYLQRVINRETLSPNPLLKPSNSRNTEFRWSFSGTDKTSAYAIPPVSSHLSDFSLTSLVGGRG